MKSNLLKKLNPINILFPEYCLKCWKKWSYLCNKCKKTLKSHIEICPWCHRFSKDFQVCHNCKKNFQIKWLIIPFSYQWILKKIILKFKYYHKKSIWNFLIDRVYRNLLSNETFQNEILRKKLIITHVPSFWVRKFFIKWYNQSEILAKRLSKKTWYKYKKILIKNKNTKTQAKLNRKQRLSNLKWVFKIKKWIKLQWNEIILIVDDVTTTWSTINELAKTIKKTYPNITIRWVVIARHT